MKKIGHFFSNYKFILILILVIGLVFRFYQLSLVPPGLYPDEAVNGTDAIRVMETGNFDVFYEANNGREGLFINLIALSFLAFGVSLWSLKFVGALLGFLTILGFYFLVKDLFTKRIASIASFLLATSFWHVNFSRIAFRAILVPFFLVWFFYFLFSGIRKNRYWDFVASGLFFGLGFYSYLSFRVVPLILVVLLLGYLWIDKEFLGKYWKKILIFIFVAFLTVLPLLNYFMAHPGDIIGRAGQVSIFTTPNPLKVILQNIVLSLGMFNFYGDLNWRHNFSSHPALHPLVSIAFLIGFGLAIYYLVKYFKDRNKDFIGWLFLITWFLVMLLPEVLSSEGLPHALRAIGTLPVCFVLAGFGFEKIFFQKQSKYLILLCVIFLLFVGVLEANRYFNLWANRPEVHQAFSETYLNIGRYCNNLERETKKYIIVNVSGVRWQGFPVAVQTVKFSTYNQDGAYNTFYLLPDDLDGMEVVGDKAVFILMAWEEKIISELKERFPKGQLLNIDFNPGYGTNFPVYKVGF